jgi:hypothetical protein
LPGGKVGAGAIVGVIEAKARWIRSEGETAHAVSGDGRSAFLGGSIHIGGNALAMPVQLFGSVGVVEDVDDCGAAFLEPE